MINWPSNAFHVVKNVLPELAGFSSLTGDVLVDEASAVSDMQPA